jgi:uncharacterized protein with beta-barrel porin domain
VVKLARGRSPLRKVLLASTAISALGAGDAIAACNVTSAPNSVACAANTTTTFTTNTDAGTPSSSDYRQRFTTGGAVSGTVNAGVSIDGNGLFIDNTTQAGAASAITFINNGSIKSANALTSALDLQGNGGLISYSGSGTVSSFPLGGNGLNARNQNGGSILIDTGTGAVSSNPGSAIAATADGAGTVTITAAGAVIGGTTGISTSTVNGLSSVTASGGVSGFQGILALASGAGSILVNANGGTIFSNGGSIVAVANGGNVTVNGNGSNINVAGLGTAIYASTSGSGNTVINLTAGSVSSGGIVSTAIVATHGAGSGNVSVDVAAGVVVAATSSNNATALAMTNTGTGTATATILGTLSSNPIAFSVDHVAASYNGTLNVGNGGVTGTLIGDVNMLDSNTVIRFNRSDSAAYDHAIHGAGSFQQNGTGTLTLSGVSDFTGATQVNAGTLLLNGAQGGTSGVSVASGATLGGSGGVATTGAVVIAGGGTLAPGSGTAVTSFAINGNLAFQSGAFYLVQVDPATASSTNVSGTAALGGATVNAVFAPGSYVSKQYTILAATGGRFGTFAADSVNTNLSPNFHTTLSYDATHAYLNLILDFSIPGGLNGNQQAVGNALTNYFNSNGSIPAVFASLSGAGLTQASGEIATGSQQTTFNAMSQFLGLLTDPFSAGHESGASGPPAFAENESASAYAAVGRKRTGSEREAYGMITKTSPRYPAFDPRWNVWAAGFGGAQATDGNTALGSNNTTSRVFGMAAGADYWFSPKTVAGFALAGGGTNFSVTNGGTGRSDLFQAGAFVRHTEGPAYITAAMAYGWQDITTDRTITIAGVDRLRANFNANAWSGRVEGGYRFVAPWIGGVGVTPYAAVQATTFDLPAYAEGVVSGAGTFALSYAAKSVTDPRSELGIRTDKSWAMADSIVTLRGRLAWAHDFNPDRALAATFQALPGASFVVNGARQASDSALTTGSIERKWSNGFSLAATFEGEFSDVTRSYAGKGVVRYAW